MSNTPTLRYLRIGQLAARTGLSAKALRLYEQRGLLRPCSHSAAGYRLYGPASLTRLRQIVLLKHSGFALADIGRLLAGDPSLADRLIVARIAMLERDVAARMESLAALRVLAANVASASTLDQLLETIVMSTQIETDLTAQQRTDMQQRLHALGSEGMQQAQQAWPQLIAEVRTAMQADVAADSDTARALARRWHALVQAATGGDAEVTRKIGEAWQRDGAAMAAQGMDTAMFGYIGRAMAAAGLSF